jgi:hypothetical protein
MPRRFRPTGYQRAPSIDNTRLQPQTEFVMKHGDDARAEELSNLKLALATFVLQLDAFEMRMHEGLPRARKPGKAAPRTDGGGEPRKDN